MIHLEKEYFQPITYCLGFFFQGAELLTFSPHIGIDANLTRKVKLVTLNSVLQYYPLIIMVIEQQVNAHCSASYAVAFSFVFINTLCNILNLSRYEAAIGKKVFHDILEIFGLRLNIFLKSNKTKIYLSLTKVVT